jgi:hypothetical protein
MDGCVPCCCTIAQQGSRSDRSDDRKGRCPPSDGSTLRRMKSFREGQLVTVAGADGAALDGIVVHVPSLVKVEVAVFDAERGPVFRVVHPKVLTERTESGEHDEVLHRLIRRAPAGGRVGPRSGPAHGRRGHSRASGHRTTGK